MRKTKIICTIGPASENEETLTQMCLEGMNVARLNFSHGTHEEQGNKVALIKKVREKLGLPIAIMLDTKGPEYRVKTFADKKVNIKTGQIFTFTTEDIEGDETKVSVNYPELHNELNEGSEITVCNGMVKFRVKEILGKDIICTCEAGGEISNRKSMSFPNKVMKGPYLSEQDKADIIFGIEQGIDFVAASFVSTRQDVEDIRNLLDKNGGEDIEIIAKIENQSGVDNVEEICEIADGIMIARGDLGVEIPFEKLPSVQKYLCSKCRALGKRVVTATEMLESMITNPRPTRAEVSDVANAVYEGSSCIMLSGETAAGKYPVEAVKTMSMIAQSAEVSNEESYKSAFRLMPHNGETNLDNISHAVCAIAQDVNAKAIVVCTVSGKTAMLVSRFRTPVSIMGMTTDVKVWRRLSICWGVTPVLSKHFENMDEMFDFAAVKAKEVMNLSCGDNIILTGSPTVGHPGTTDTIKLKTVE